MFERAKTIREIWAWLPAFRVVAETRHLTHAADQLGVTPAALSRTIAKLEKATGLRLFERVPRGMLLTEAGSQLAEGVRDTMRRCDDVLSSLTPAAAHGAPLRVAFDEPAFGMLLDACLAELVAHLERPLVVTAMEVPRMAAGLLSGEVDLAFAHVPSTDDRVVCKPLGAVPVRWATAGRHALPPTGQRPRLELPPAVAPPSPELLRHTVVLVPQVVPLGSKTRSAAAEPLTLWRLTRTRPARRLLDVADRVAARARGLPGR